jgi:hypothetical protein
MAAHARDNGGWQTSTVIESQHPQLFADGLFEYQHANGADEQASLLSGFQAWARVDLATLQTAIGAQDAQGLPMMGLTYPAGDDGEEHERTVVLGPLAHYRAQDVDASTCSEDDHGSCPCCLFTRSMEAFDELLKARHSSPSACSPRAMPTACARPIAGSTATTSPPPCPCCAPMPPAGRRPGWSSASSTW